MKWLIFRISVRLVIGMWFMVDSVVVSMMKFEFVMLVVFLEVSSSMFRSVSFCMKVMGVLVVWVMNMVVMVR